MMSPRDKAMVNSVLWIAFPSTPGKHAIHFPGVPVQIHR